MESSQTLSWQPTSPVSCANTPAGPHPDPLPGGEGTFGVRKEGIMTTRMGINGFGRIGRQVLRGVLENHPKDLEVVAVNDLTDTRTNAHLFKYDSSYGIYPGSVEAREEGMAIDNKLVKV